MAKVRLLLWTVGVAAAAVLLLSTARAPDVDDPAVATMAVVQIVGGVLAAYLCGATLLAVRLPRLAPRVVQRLVAAALGGGMLVSPLAATAAPRESGARGEAPVLHLVDDDPTAPAPAPELDDPSRQATAAAQTSAAVELVVAPGDHFWRIAERIVGERLGRTPTDPEVAEYWRRLIAANVDRLVVPGDADYLEVGQVLRVVPS